MIHRIRIALHLVFLVLLAVWLAKTAMETFQAVTPLSWQEARDD